MEFFLQIVANGVMLGGLYALIALGLALVFGVMRILNVAHGDLMVLGAVVTLLLFRQFGLPPYIGLVVAAGALVIIGSAIQRFIVERVMRAEELVALLVLFGTGIVIRHSLESVMGAEFFSVPYWSGSISVLGISLSRPRLYSFVIAAVATTLLFLVLHRTSWGKAIRATAMAPQLASATGIDVRRTRVAVFAIGAALAGLAGALLVTSTALNPLAGDSYLLVAFTATVLGGLGSLTGALAAGLIIGIVGVSVGSLADSQVAQMAVYVMFIAVLVFKPSGLVGTQRA